MDNSFGSNVKNIVELLEASHLGLESEIILDEAKNLQKIGSKMLSRLLQVLSI
jgi:hypothetical protein